MKKTAVIRDRKAKNFTVMSNRPLRETEMSLKAKGLLALLLSLPEDWDFSIKGICAICKENESAVRAALGELKRFGYLKIRMKKPNETQSGRIEYEYDIFERPTKKQSCENLYTEKEQTEILTTEKRAQLNKDKQNKDKLNKDKSNTNKENKAKERLAPGNVENVENFSDEDNVLSLEEMRRIFDKYSGFGS